MPRLYARVEDFAGLAVLVLDGDVDVLGTPQVRDELAAAVDAQRGSVVAVDLDAVASFDDLALGAVLGAAGRARAAGGDLIAVCSPGRLRSRLALTGFDRAVRVVDSIAEARRVAQR